METDVFCRHFAGVHDSEGHDDAVVTSRAEYAAPAEIEKETLESGERVFLVLAGGEGEGETAEGVRPDWRFRMLHGCTAGFEGRCTPKWLRVAKQNGQYSVPSPAASQ